MARVSGVAASSGAGAPSVAAGASVAGGVTGGVTGAAGASAAGASGASGTAGTSGTGASVSSSSSASASTLGGDPVLSAILALPEAEYFYLGGIDPYRMIVNTDYGQYLSPRKKYPRSETVDFQRGEVEWKGGNLYFNKWSYSLEIL